MSELNGFPAKMTTQSTDLGIKIMENKEQKQTDFCQMGLKRPSSFHFGNKSLKTSIMVWRDRGLSGHLLPLCRIRTRLIGCSELTGTMIAHQLTRICPTIRGWVTTTRGNDPSRIFPIFSDTMGLKNGSGEKDHR